jgi:hypothetical protein
LRSFSRRTLRETYATTDNNEVSDLKNFYLLTWLLSNLHFPRMNYPGSNKVKIAFRFYSDILDQEAIERMWARVIDERLGLYKLESIPFYAKSLAVGDTIVAVYNEEEKALTFQNIIKFSGHSTVQVVILDKSVNTEAIRTVFHELGCGSEKQFERYFSLDIPPGISYHIVRDKLCEMEAGGMISYAEACVSDEHREAAETSPQPLSKGEGL